ncbi:hypothetical protein GCM10022631_26340 [Deinococcus rubellus]
MHEAWAKGNARQMSVKLSKDTVAQHWRLVRRAPLKAFIRDGLKSGQSDEQAFELDRSDVLPMPERDLL